MKRSRSILMLLSVSMLLTSMAHASSSQTKTYAPASPVAVQAQLPATIRIGGNWFSGGPGETAQTVTIRDASLEAVAFMVCQDLNGDSVCGNRDAAAGALEPRVSDCATSADLSTSAVPFQPDTITRVFVLTATADCTNVATSGTITVSFG